MICIIKRNNFGEIVGWVIANDFAEARRNTGDEKLAAWLYDNESQRENSLPSMTDLPLGDYDSRYTLLRSF